MKIATPLTPGPSVWWPVPAAPSTWFSDEELARSERYHRPVRWAGLGKVAGRVGLLVAAAAALETTVDPGRSLAGFVVAVVMVAIAWWLPAAAADAWFELRHEPRFGRSAMPMAPMLGVTVAGLLITGLVVGAGAAAVFTLNRHVEQWWLPSALLAVAVGLGAGWVASQATVSGLAVGPVDHDDLDLLAQRAGLTTPVEFGVTDSDAVEGLNALVIGDRRVVLSRPLASTDRALRHHVVGHELSHVRRRHPRVSAAVSALAGGLAVGVGCWMADRLLPIEPRRLPLIVLLIAGLAVATLPVTAWISRAHERQADRDAMIWTPEVTVEQLRLLHVTDRADLRPPRWVGLLAPHPAPAERLARAARIRPTGTV